MRQMSLFLLASALVVSPMSAQDSGAVGAQPRTYDPDRPGEVGYDPSADPNHPLRGLDDPGPAWDGPHRRADGTPNIKVLGGDWSWGELEYDRTYPTALTVVNNCSWDQDVTLEVRNLPWLSINRRARIPANDTVALPATIRTPPAPPAPILAGPNPFPGGFLFIDITDGEVLVWHPWAIRGSSSCEPKRVAWKVTGHIHFLPPAPDAGGGGPSKLATPSPCVVWWNTGERPANATMDCTEEMRVLALHYRERILQAHAETDPLPWDWLPDGPTIRGMAVAELLGMRSRADGLING